MRIASFGVERIFGKLASFCIELANIGLEFCREPDVALLIHHQAVRTGARSGGMIFLDVSRLWVDVAEQIAHVSRVPDCAVRRGERIVRPRARRGDFPFLEGTLYISGNRHS